MQRCPQCGKEYSDEANFCPVDAATLVPLEAAEAGDAEGLIGGRFRLGEPIAGRRTGEVYGAVDETGGVDCVLKLVNADVFPTPLVLQRSERELKKLAGLAAPGVAKVLAHGRADDKLWIAVEEVDGNSLQQIVESQGALLPNQAAELVNTVGEALAAAAKIGVVHRDLAPKNVLLTDELNVKLINFGVPVPPTSGKASGVPEYVAPEQLKGKPIDQRSNIYSLGAIYYFALTGHAPTPGEAPANVDSLSRETNAVLQKALEQSSSKRYMTLRQLLREVSSASGKDAGSTQPMGQAGKALSTGGKSKKNKKALKQTLVGGFAVVDGAVVAGSAAAAGAAAAAGGASAAASGGASSASASGTIGGATSGSAKPNIKSTVMGHSGVEDAQSAKATAEMDSEPAAPSPAATLGGLPASPPGSSLDVDDQMAATMTPAESASLSAGGPAVTAEDSASVTAPRSKKAVSQANSNSGAGAGAAAAGVAANVVAASAKAAAGAGAAVASAAPPAKRSGATGKGKSRGKKKNAAAKKKRRSNKGKFRETMWFKKGALDAEAASRAAEGSDKKGLPESDKADEMPMEDRYEDDGSLSHEDANKFSLRTGHTEMMPAIQDERPVSGGVSEDYLVRELQGGRGKYIAMIGGGLVLLVVLLIVVMSGGGGGDDDEDEDAKKVDAAPPAAVKKKATKKAPVKVAPSLPAEATAALDGLSAACKDKKSADAWAMLRPELQKVYGNIAKKNRRNRRWLRKQGFKGKWTKFNGAAYFGTVIKRDTKWSPCHGSAKWDVKGAKLDASNKDQLVMPSASETGPVALVFTKSGDKWLLAQVKNRKK